MNKNNEKIIKIVTVNPESAINNKPSNQQDFSNAMIKLRQRLKMNEQEFINALTTYMHDEARRDGVQDDSIY